MSNQINIENFRNVLVLDAKPTSPKKLPRHKHGEGFLCGPVPLNWLTAASKQSGRTMSVAIAIWYLCGLNSHSCTVRLTGKTLRKFWIKQKSGYRALRALEKAGLIVCERKRGRCPLITVIEAPAMSNGNGKEGSMTGDKS